MELWLQIHGMCTGVVRYFNFENLNYERGCKFYVNITVILDDIQKTVRMLIFRICFCKKGKILIGLVHDVVLASPPPSVSCQVALYSPGGTPDNCNI